MVTKNNITFHLPHFLLCLWHQQQPQSHSSQARINTRHVSTMKMSRGCSNRAGKMLCYVTFPCFHHLKGLHQLFFYNIVITKNHLPFHTTSFFYLPFALTTASEAALAGAGMVCNHVFIKKIKGFTLFLRKVVMIRGYIPSHAPHIFLCLWHQQQLQRLLQQGWDVDKVCNHSMFHCKN